MAKAKLVITQTDPQRAMFQSIARNLQSAHHRIDRVRQSLKSPTVPIYEPDFPPDAVEGQLALAPGTAGGGAGLANAVMKKSNTQTIAGSSVTQVTLDSTTFATTDSSAFSASGSNIVIATPGLYAAYIHYVDDNATTDPSTTEFYPKWLGATVNANEPWQLAVPRMFNNNGPSGLQGADPIGGGVADSIANFSIAYVSEVDATVGAWMATLSASSITTSTCLLVVVQLQAIADLSAFPSYPN